MTPETTFELKVCFVPHWPVKHLVIGHLQAQGITSFVEGFVDGIDVDPNADAEIAAQVERLGSGAAPLLLYSYDRDYLQGVAADLSQRFGQQIDTDVQDLRTDGWLTGWQKSFEPIGTTRFLIQTPWHAPVTDDETRIPIIIEPAMAFGTGQHESTRLCLRLLEKHQPAAATVFDIGTGSGILAIAAAKLGATRVDACDIDPDAVAATEANAKINDTHITAWQSAHRPEVHPSHRYDLVIANILAPVILDLFPELSAATAPGGLLLLSGFLDEQTPDIVAAAATYGFSEVDRRQENDWIGLLLRRAP